jgi:hypothetical protein
MELGAVLGESDPELQGDTDHSPAVQGWVRDTGKFENALGLLANQ